MLNRRAAFVKLLSCFKKFADNENSGCRGRVVTALL